MKIELEVVWSGELEAKGLAPGLSTYQGDSATYAGMRRGIEKWERGLSQIFYSDEKRERKRKDARRRWRKHAEDHSPRA